MATKTLVTLPIRTLSSVVTGRRVLMSATPEVPRQEPDVPPTRSWAAVDGGCRRSSTAACRAAGSSGGSGADSAAARCTGRTAVAASAAVPDTATLTKDLRDMRVEVMPSPCQRALP